MTQTEKNTWSVSALRSMTFCGESYRKRYVEKEAGAKPKQNRVMGEVVGTAIQWLCKQAKRPDFNAQESLNGLVKLAFSSALKTVFELPAEREKFTPQTKYCTPDFIVTNLRTYVKEYNEKTLSFITEERKMVELERKEFIENLDKQILSYTSLGWKYKPMSSTRSGDRLLHILPWYEEQIYNGFSTLLENGYLYNIEEVYDEFKFSSKGQHVILEGRYDLLIQYKDKTFKLFEIKASEAKKTLEPASKGPTEDAVMRDLQVNFYDLSARKTFGDLFKGTFFMNVAYRDHIVQFKKNDLILQNFLQTLMNADALRNANIYLPSCGSANFDSAAVYCSHAHKCIYTRKAES